MVDKKTKGYLCELSQYTCELCKKKYNQSELEIHRIRRGSKGGTYEFRNCKVLCKSCHKLVHSGEFT